MYPDFMSRRNSFHGNSTTPRPPAYRVKIIGGKKVVVWTEPELTSSSYLRSMMQLSDPTPLRGLRTSTDKRLLNDDLASSQTDQPQLGSKYKALPPIKSDDSESPQHVMVRAGSLDELAKVTLRNEVRHQIAGVTDRTLEMLLIDLRKRDRDRDGYLSSPQIHGVIKRFEIPLEASTEQTLMSKFAQMDVAGFVNYEKLLSYIQMCKKEAPVRPMSGTASLPPVHSPQPKAAGRQISLIPSKDEARLTVDLERDLANDIFDFEKVRDAFRAKDTDTTGLIAQEEVEQVLQNVGLNMSQNVLNRWLNASDAEGRGKYSIERLLYYLERVQPEVGQLLRGAPMKGAMMTFFFAQPANNNNNDKQDEPDQPEK